MAKYLIGDIHGCADEFAQLLEDIKFDPSKDELYLAGDLVGRGPKPKEVLDLAIANNAKAVLGNYDLHFLACLYGARQTASDDNFDSLLSLSAEEKEYYASWLKSQGFVREDDGFYLVHASLNPTWVPEQITEIAQQVNSYFATWGEKEFKQIFSNKRFIDYLEDLSYTEKDDIFMRRFLESMLIFTICRFRAIRSPAENSIIAVPSAQEVVNQVGKDKLERLSPSLLIEDFSKDFFDFQVGKGKPECDKETGVYPWFDYARAKKENVRKAYKNPNFNFVDFKKPVYFGHWSYCNGVKLPAGFICSDTSCVYGGHLSAYRLPDYAVNMQDKAFLLKLAQPCAQVAKK
ncbi:hypothetical protein CKF54_00980 [Psittacicella hinzii]|uniref:Calcineurin-like phosphoesterase domain-containing protein n=1 Tax=Psittacicella hinzii TaxID=2028575 RepID=A0A3A1Y9D0_9GAMM|nr:metallophosphoesterase [Psittacicella hinzii]RIY34285.1 hypothetical protein CKF54_00980 [Psittacicella hinzii]